MSFVCLNSLKYSLIINRGQLEKFKAENENLKERLSKYEPNVLDEAK